MSAIVEVRDSTGGTLFAGTATARLQWFVQGSHEGVRVIEDTGAAGLLVVTVL